MKKLFLSVSMLLALLTLIVLAGIPSQASAETSTNTVCPAGYICRPATVQCPAGFICVRADDEEEVDDSSDLSHLSKREAVRQLYLTLEHREPEPQGWEYWTNYQADIDTIRQQMMSGIEYQTKQKIIQIFQDVYDRDPSDLELTKWYYTAEYLGYNTEAVRDSLTGTRRSSSEQVSRPVKADSTAFVCPAGYTCNPNKDNSRQETPVNRPVQSTTSTKIVAAPTVDDRRAAIIQLYVELLHRMPDQGGLEYWAGQSGSISETKQSMMAGIEYRTKQNIISIFNDVLHRAPSDQELSDWYYKVELAGYNTGIVRTGLSASPLPVPLTATAQSAPAPVQGFDTMP